MPKAIVVGGGVAGPAVAQFLTEIGWEAPVFEARPAPDPYEGLFLNVAANGRRVLSSLGVEQRLLTDAHAASSMVMWSGRGKQLGVVPNGPANRPADGGVVVRRSWLHQVIGEGADSAGVRVAYDRCLVAVEHHRRGVAATFADGHVEEGDLVVGADGIGSVVREHIAPGVAPSFSGLLGTGGFAHVPGLAPTPGVQHMVFGARSFFGYLVRADSTVYWFANLTADEPPALDAPGESSRVWLARLQKLHADDPHPVPQILEHTDGPVGGYPIFRLPTVPAWSRDRAVALGDAVHAASPSAGQGAPLALEDAVVLATSLRDHAEYGDAFAAYERARRQRTEAIVAYAATIDKQKRVTTSRIGIAIRDAMLPMFLRKAAGDARNDWVYDYHVPWLDSGSAQGRSGVEPDVSGGLGSAGSSR